MCKEFSFLFIPGLEAIQCCTRVLPQSDKVIPQLCHYIWKEIVLFHLLDFVETSGV